MGGWKQQVDGTTVASCLPLARRSPFGFDPWVELLLQPVEDPRDLRGGSTRRQLLHDPELPARESGAGQVLLAIDPECSGADVVLDETPHTGKLAERVEVANQSHPGIGVEALLLINVLGGSEKSDIHADKDRRPALARRADTEIPPARVACGDWSASREEVVVDIDSAWRE